MLRSYYVYIMASGRNGTLYVGVTGSLERRIHSHSKGLECGFTRRHRVTRLVYFERHSSIVSAIAREKSLKRWRRHWKVELIERYNPYWRDLSGADIDTEKPLAPGSSPG